MRFVSASVTALAAVGMVLGTGAAAFACDWHMQVTAQSTPVPQTDEVATPVTTIDPLTLAKLDQAAILPVAPKEEETETE